MAFDVRILRGSPDDAELAALVTVLTALAARSTVDSAGATPSTWNLVPLPRSAPEVGEGAWRASGLPR
jgi:hypothetical protein